MAQGSRARGEGPAVGRRWRPPHRALCLVALVACLSGCGGPSPPIDPDPPTLVERVVAPRQQTGGTSPPLLVLLHGLGASENDLVPLANRLDPRFLAVSVRAPRPYRNGFAWFRIDWRADGTLVPDTEQARTTLDDLVRWIAAAPARLGADAHRVYLLGFSQGAMMSLGALRTAPERLAGVVALSGTFRDTLFGVPGASTAAMARVALFVGHGTNDDLLPVADGRAIRDAFAPVVPDFTYRDYPLGHAIGPTELRDVAARLTTRLDREGPAAPSS